MIIREPWRGPIIGLGALWLAVAGVGGYVATDATLHYRFEYVYDLRDGVTVKSGEPARPLYELVKSPSEVKLPVRFVPLGYLGVPRLRDHEGRRVEFVYPDGYVLHLSRNLTEQDQEYVKEAFVQQRYLRDAVRRSALQTWLMILVLPPMFVLGALWIGTRFKIPE
jgi:hypothetical protein